MVSLNDVCGTTGLGHRVKSVGAGVAAGLVAAFGPKVAGTLKVGKGRIAIFGSLLPQPTEKYPHWFGLNGYTISTGIISDDLDPEIVAIPLDVDERIEIGWIGHSAIPLTEQAQRYLAELRAVVSGFGVALLG